VSLAAGGDVFLGLPPDRLRFTSLAESAMLLHSDENSVHMYVRAMVKGRLLRKIMISKARTKRTKLLLQKRCLCVRVSGVCGFAIVCVRVYMFVFARRCVHV
jgi:hypothetical protein